MSWPEQAIHVIDFEGNRSSGILEYGVATLRRGEVVGTLTRLCAPTGRVREEESAVHGLVETDLAGCAPFSADWETFAGLRASGPFAAHCAGVENSLLKAVWPYVRGVPDFARPGGGSVEWGPWVDSAALHAQAHPDLESGKLAQLVAALSLQPELDALAARHCPESRLRYHAALYDALAAALLLAALARAPSWSALGLPQLLALSTLDGGKRDALLQQKLW